jgi:cytochrome c
VQAQRGDSIYKAGCVTCHGNALQGGTTADFGDSAPLVGPEFMATWNGQTLADLYDKIFSSMPADKPKTLDKQVIVDVMAHILNQNHFPAGSKDLDADHDRLNEVKIVPAKPATPPPIMIVSHLGIAIPAILARPRSGGRVILRSDKFLRQN